ncbi:hypothetical protein LH991_14570 [Schleiferilactobacillus harbinensis]|uniref:Uncharacterized protein n=1 Tax=Schleiferilactobacillus harbinensis DSM 16991 TaxID=1122147 RepID=A0A0R1X3S7_9LACO|nr:hypothetical protein [Schleiferilactobacillus harbinensis]KRM24864.1 hypothetical protein FC91_GL001232 [Schleiferilactobacillus harbinensis DSM 16991]QFR65070.1 hypothetical protein LH991_14570 [Schleiferilactobacillus harbinensis]
MKLTIEFSTTELQKMLRAIAGGQEHEKFRVNIDGDGIHFSDSEGELKASADGSFSQGPID